MVSAAVAGTTFRPPRSYTTLRDVTWLSLSGDSTRAQTHAANKPDPDARPRQWNASRPQGSATPRRLQLDTGPNGNSYCYVLVP
jgi:hypothetical protein